MQVLELKNMAFSVGSNVHAVDEMGRWCGGKVWKVEDGWYFVKFAGYNAEFHRWVPGDVDPREIWPATTKKEEGEALYRSVPCCTLLVLCVVMDCVYILCRWRSFETLFSGTIRINKLY